MSKGTDEEELVGFKPSDMLSTGSTMLNLALTGNPRGGHVKGCMTWDIGASTSGKTWRGLAALAEAARNPHFDDYDLIHDDVEYGREGIDIGHYFGKKLLARLQSPHRVNGEPVNSFYVEDFYYSILERLKSGKPFVWVEDSMDALQSKLEDKKLEAAMEEYLESVEDGDAGPAEDEEGEGDEKKPRAGEYGVAKAKTNSRLLGRVVGQLRKTGSILIMISQTRENINPATSRFNPNTVSGGKALKFYCHSMYWTSVVETFKKTVSGKDLEVGVMTRIKTEKNRFTGRKRTVDVPIYYSLGIDDIGSCVDYLVDWKKWTKVKGSTKITAPDIDFEGTRDAIIKKIETENLQKVLRATVAENWDAVEESLIIKGRKPLYD